MMDGVDPLVLRPVPLTGVRAFDLLRASPPPTVAGWAFGGFGLVHLRAGPAPLTLAGGPGPDHAVILTLAACQMRVRIGDAEAGRRSHAGQLCVIPAGTAFRLATEQGGAFLHLSLPPEMLEACAAADPDLPAPRLTPAAFTTDMAVAVIGHACLGEAVAPGRASAKLMESYCQALAVRLLRGYAAGGDHTNGPAPIALAPFRLRRALDFIEARLEETITLADVAAAVGLSPKHFARAFRRSTGQSPHRFIVQRRLERAKTMMLGTELALTEIALACGFGSQQHFTRVFREAVGMPPGQWRDGARD